MPPEIGDSGLDGETGDAHVIRLIEAGRAQGVSRGVLDLGISVLIGMLDGMTRAGVTAESIDRDLPQAAGLAIGVIAESLSELTSAKRSNSAGRVMATAMSGVTGSPRSGT